MFDSLNRHMLPPYGDTVVDAPNFARLASRAVTFDNFYAGSMPCIPARRELHTGRYNFLHRSWGPLEPFDDSMPQMLKEAGVHTHLVSDHPHYWEDGGATFHTRYSTWEFFRGQEGDPWKGDVDALRTQPGAGIQKQDAVNRPYMQDEADRAQTRTVDAGIEFLTTNAGADRWMLQLELFDPHEPFFVPDTYLGRYRDDYSGPATDWPPYQKVTETEDVVAHLRTEYAALVSMCDHSLGRVLDFMDQHAMWEDTLLFVITDHGFLLGEHGWWAKSVQPWFNELVHIPMFLWDPRTGGADIRRGALAQTIDIAPTMLRFFGLEPTPDMEGRDLAAVLDSDRKIRDGALFGIHGGHVNVTDGRYVYMRASATEANAPLEEYTLMPTHMRARFSPAELQEWDRSDPLPFTKGVPVMRIPARGLWLNPWSYGSLLFDLERDPDQRHPIDDPGIELRMLRLMAALMHDDDAPRSQFERLGIPYGEEPSANDLLVRSQAARAQQMAAPIPSDLVSHPKSRLTLAELEADPRAWAAVGSEIPDLEKTEGLTLPPTMTLLDLAASALIPASGLEAILRALDGLAD
jgi:arylsulfatase A-like enzyme